jgi:hypothetical protein
MVLVRDDNKLSVAAVASIALEMVHHRPAVCIRLIVKNCLNYPVPYTIHDFPAVSGKHSSGC